MVLISVTAGVLLAAGSMVLGAWLFRFGQKSLFSWLNMAYPTHDELIEASKDAMVDMLSSNDAEVEEEY